MQVIINPVERLTFRQWADKNNLVMVVTERNVPVYDDGRYYARFQNVEVRERTCMLASYCGNGNTPDAAIADYQKQILGRLLIENATSETDRREIYVPLHFEPDAEPMLAEREKTA